MVNKYTEYTSRRFYNAGYFKLFLMLNNIISENYDKQTLELNQQYERLSKFALILEPKKFNIEDRECLNKLRELLLDQDIHLFLLYSDFYLEANENRTHTFTYNSLTNTNYSFISEDNEISASALSILLDLDIKEEAKFLLFEKNNDREFSFVGIPNYCDFQTRLPRYLNKTSKHKLQKPFNTQLLSFLALFWSSSKSEKYVELKEIALDIQDELFTTFKNENKIAELNILKSVGNVTNRLGPIGTQDVFFSLSEQNPDDELVEDLSKNLSVNEIQELLPHYSLKKIISIQKRRIRQNIQRLVHSEKVDFKSKIFLKSANIINELYGNQETDYSPIIIGYSKFFENEINCSIVQYIRKHLGIKMPDYYLKFCDINDKYYVFINSKFSVNFNKRDHIDNTLIPPGLGQTLISFKNIRSENISKSKQDLLIQYGLRVNRIRNKAAHIGILSKNNLEEIEELISEMYDANLFDIIWIIKSNLSST